MNDMNEQLRHVFETRITSSLEDQTRTGILKIGFEMGMEMALLCPEWVGAYIKENPILDASREGTEELAASIPVEVAP